MLNLRRLSFQAVIYAAGNLIVKGSSVLLLALYTRYLTPADYGVLAVCTTISSVLAFIYPLGLNAGVTRLFHQFDDEERRRFLGSVWLATFVFALVTTGVLSAIGEPIGRRFLADIPFSPYIKLTLWVAFFNVFGLLPLSVLQMQERPTQFSLFNIANVVLTSLCVIGLVVWQNQGVAGYLQGMLMGAVVLSFVYIGFMFCNMRLAFEFRYIKRALSFGLPMVSHSLASWILELSDRLILQRYVPLSDLGLYNVAYQFSGLMMLIAGALNNVWVPFFYKQMDGVVEDRTRSVSRAATYYIGALGFVAFVAILFLKDVLVLLTDDRFHAAHQFIVPVVLGYLCSALYFIPSNFLLLKKETAWFIPAITVLAGVGNVVLNLWLVPIWGVWGAVWATLFAYLLVGVLNWGAALYCHPFPFELRRIFLLFCLIAVFTFLGILCLDLDTGLSIILKLCLVFMMPLVLWGLGFLDQQEKQTVRDIVNSWRGRHSVWKIG